MLGDAGAFRVPRLSDTWEIFDAPKFEGEVFDVDGCKGPNVESGEQTLPVKTSLAVPAGSAAIDIRIQTHTCPGEYKYVHICIYK